MRVLRALPALLLIGAALPQYYTIDPARTDVSAKVAFFGLASKTAQFPRASGRIALDPADPERIELTVKLDATALTAPDSITLGRLKGPKFFDVANHPTILFVGRRMRMKGALDADIAGEITARGVTRPATLAVHFTAPPLRSDFGRTLVLDGTTRIDRRDFGMTAYPLIVGRTVAIRIRATMVPA